MSDTIVQKISNADLANGLRDFAEWLEHTPELERPYPEQKLGMNVWLESKLAVKGVAAALGATVEEHPTPKGNLHTITEVSFGNAVNVDFFHIEDVTR